MARKKTNQIEKITAKTTRIVVAYTPNFACDPYKIVYNDLEEGKFGSWEEAYRYYYKKKAEDPSIRLFFVSQSLTNEDLLNSLNYSMELSTPTSMYYADAGIRARRAIEQLDKIIGEYYSGILESEELFQDRPKEPIRRGKNS